MQRWLRALCGFIALAVWPPAAVSGQDWSQPWFDPMDRPPRVDLSATVGFLLPTDWSDLVLLGSISSTSGVFEQVLVRDIRVEPGASWAAAITYWRGHYGFRAHGEFSRSSARLGGPSFPGQLMSITMKTWLYDVRGTVGLAEYRPRRAAWPYAFVGVGGITYDLAQTVTPPLLTFIEGRPGRIPGSGDVLILADRGREFLLAIDELSLETVLALNVGVGTDFRVPLGPGGVGVRLELSDHISRSPLEVRLRELSPLGPSDRPLRFGFVHHLRAAAGLVVQLGR